MRRRAPVLRDGTHVILEAARIGARCKQLIEVLEVAVVGSEEQILVMAPHMMSVAL